jgi:transposase
MAAPTPPRISTSLTDTTRSDRLAAAQTDIGMLLGGEPGARLPQRLAMPVSGDTVLRLIRRRNTRPPPPPRVVGIDNWAWRRGSACSTIVCDLERCRVLDLLPGRAAGPVRDWLAAQPSVIIISRDRSGPYAEAARTGAPQSRQVADRWHLLVNASEALRGVVERHQPEIREAVSRTAHASSASQVPIETAPTSTAHGRRRDRCEMALRLHGEGLPIREIARRIGASRNAVRRWPRTGWFMPCRRAPGPSRLDRHLPFVETRWQDGERSVAVLHRELCAQGFTRGYDIVRRWAARHRSGVPARPPSARIPSTRRITQWLTADPAALLQENHAFTEALYRAVPELESVAEVVRAFAQLLRQGDSARLTTRLEAVARTDLGGFATGLWQDEAAVRAIIVEPWSNGLVEGQVTRLKLVKWSMYGHARFDLLRQRVLHAS